MSETLRDRIVVALYNSALKQSAYIREGDVDFTELADAILAIPGIAVVELPEPECVTDNTAGWAGWTWAVNRNVGVVIVDMDSGGCAVSPDQARKLAAALLAAAEHAERDQAVTLNSCPDSSILNWGAHLAVDYAEREQ